MDIKIDELKKIIDRLLDELRKRNNLIKVSDEDYYWFINDEELFSPYEEPKSITLGQLSDDWSELQALLNEERDCVSRDFVSLCSILRVISKNEIW